MEANEVIETVDAAVANGERVFELLIVRTMDGTDLAIHAVGHDDDEAQAVVNILRELANEIEGHFVDTPHALAH